MSTEAKDADMQEAIHQAEAELKEAEALFGPNDLTIACKLEALATILRQSKTRLLDAANLDARAKVIRARTKEKGVDEPTSSESTKTKEGAEEAHDTKTCPFCAEVIKTGAIICRFCRSTLSETAVGLGTSTNATVARQNPDWLSSEFGSFVIYGMIICGLMGATYFFFLFDTSVESHYGGRIANLGLMNDRSNGITFCLGLAVVGAILRFARRSRS